MSKAVSFITAKLFALRKSTRGLEDHLRNCRRLGHGDKFNYSSRRDIFEEVRVASKGGVSDYYGITWDRIDERNGIFWPCPEIGHPGTPRLYEGGKFGHPDGKAHFIPIEWRPSVEMPDEEYPVILTTGRVVSHFLSGTQTRRIGTLLDQCPSRFVKCIPASRKSVGSRMVISSKLRAVAEVS